MEEGNSVSVALPMRGIVWLASYPKSGNTWMRIVLGILTHPGWDPEDINAIPIGRLDTRWWVDRTAGIESSDLTDEEIHILSPRVYERIVERQRGPLFSKTHAGWILNAAGEPVLSATATAGAVYIVRNPLDVAVSYAHHLGRTVDQVIRCMEGPDAARRRRRKRLSPHLPGGRLSWSEHVQSWLDRAPVPVHLVRYEDMKAAPLRTFTGVVRFLGLDCSREEIEAAIEASAFERLREIEGRKGFRERWPTSTAPFFRRGEAGAWREVLTPEQVDRIVSAHGEVMRRLGYIDEVEAKAEAEAKVEG